MVAETKSTDGVLPNRMGGGPHGLGDPDDKNLRKVEKEILVPKIMRERAKETHCAEIVKSFETCCKANSLLMVLNCRAENDALKACLGRWYADENFVKECTDIYLKDRTEYRSTGLSRKQKARIAAAESNVQ